jgi:hypothetical protein
MAKWNFAFIVEIETEESLTEKEIIEIYKYLREGSQNWLDESGYVTDSIQERSHSEVLKVSVL